MGTLIAMSQDIHHFDCNVSRTHTYMECARTHTDTLSITKKVWQERDGKREMHV
jgi:hypothetical protein